MNTDPDHRSSPARAGRSLLVGCLLAAPVLLTASELVRLRVESGRVEHDDPLLDARSQLDAVAAHLTQWHVAAVLNLAFVLAWAGALAACVLLIAGRRRWAALATAVVAVVSGVGLAMHLAFYYLNLAELAGAPDRDQAAAVSANLGSGPLTVLALALFLVGGLVTPIVLGVALWRAQALPWWAALGLLVWLAAVVIGAELLLGALLNLALLLPFAAVVRRLWSEPAETGDRLENRPGAWSDTGR